MTNTNPLAEVQIPQAAGLRTKILYAALFLLFTTYCYDRLIVSYIDGLVKNNRIGLWTVLVQYLEIGASVFLILQLVAVLIFFRVGRNRIAVKPLRLQVTELTLRHAAYGALCGAAVVLAGLPLVLRFDRHSGFVTLLTGEFYTVRSALIVALLLIVLPMLSEIVFREIIFDNLQKQLSTPAAIIASSLLFAYSWPVYDWWIALLLGVGNCILYRISRNSIPGIIANIVVTSSYGAILMIRMLFQK